MKKHLLFIILALVATTTANATRYYVKPYNGGGTYNNGSGFIGDVLQQITYANHNLAKAATLWGEACADLQEVINIADPGDEIFVAAGVYKPLRSAIGWSWFDLLDFATLHPINVPIDLVTGDHTDDSGWLGSILADLTDPLLNPLRSNAFVLKNGVKIYGGFTTFTEIPEQIPAFGTGTRNGVSTLSGDFRGDDSSSLDDTHDENAHHVVIIAGGLLSTNAAVLDGFTITGGNASITGLPIIVNTATITADNGGGLYISNGANPQLSNLTVTNNYAIFNGGGIYNNDGTNTIISNSTVTGNQAGLISGAPFTGDGGGIYVEGGVFFAGTTNLTLNNVNITNNHATNDGGGLYTASSLSIFIATTNVTVNNSQITGNTATNDGGGIYSQDGATGISSGNLVLNNTVVTGNSAGDEGGGFYNNASAKLLNVKIAGNTATYDGGGIYNAHSFLTSATTAQFINVAITGNKAGRYGGGLYSQDGGLTPTLIATFAANATLTNVTIAGNYATTSGGGIYRADGFLTGGELYLNNSIVYGNVGSSNANVRDGGATFGSGYIRYTNSLLQGSQPTSNSSKNNLKGTTNPNFETFAAASAGGATTGGDFRLKSASASPVQEAGSNSLYTAARGIAGSISVSEKDLTGTAQRLKNKKIDLGAYEGTFEINNTIYYVKTTGKGGYKTSGNSPSAIATSYNPESNDWAHACADLQTVINKATTGDEIWVAKGIYAPTHSATDDATSITNPNNAFLLRSGVAIYGGFPDEGNPGMEDRNFTAYPTILSGDINTETTYDAYHVVIAAGSISDATILDGFTISDGYANGPNFFVSIEGKSLSQSDGGGLYITADAAPTFNNLIIKNNYILNDGAGIYNAGTPTFSNVSITNNTAHGSTAGNGGGGIYNTGTFTLTNADITGNSAGSLTASCGENGGGIYNYNTGNLKFTDVRIAGNTATNGPNGTSGNGGGIYTTGIANLTNVTVTGNSTANRYSLAISDNTCGGGIYIGTNSNSTTNLTNVAITGNKADDNGGGLYSSSSSTANNNPTITLTNATIAGNYASTSGGGIYRDRTLSGLGPYSGAAITVNNSIIYGNNSGGNSSVANVYSDATTDHGFLTYVNTLLQGSTPTGNGNTNNLSGSTDPKFQQSVTYSSAPTSTGDYRLRKNSPVIGVGDNSKNTTEADLVGNPRIVGTIDLGAYERQQSATGYYVKPYDPTNPTGSDNSGTYSATLFNSGSGAATITSDNITLAENATSWQTACADLQAVINIAEPGDAIFVAAGTYKPLRSASTWKWSTSSLNPINVDIASITGYHESVTVDRNNAFILKPGVTVYGGFAGDEEGADLYNLNARDLKTYATTLSGDFQENDNVTDVLDLDLYPDFEEIHEENAYHVVIASGDFPATTVFDGFTVSGGAATEATAATIAVNDENILRSNGGGFYIAGITTQSPAYTNLTIKDNITHSYGGGLYNAGSGSTLTNTTFTNNFASIGGGGIANRGTFNVEKSIITGNNGELFGGGIYNVASGVLSVTNTKIAGNISSLGAGISNGNDTTTTNINTVTLTNTAITGNSADSIAGGIFNKGNATLINTTVAGNYAKGYGIVEENAKLGLPGICFFDGTLNIQNSIVWGNKDQTGTATDIKFPVTGSHVSTPDPTYTHSLVEGITGTDNGNLAGTTDPHFMLYQPASAVPTTNGNYRLSVGSPAIDKGNNALNTTTYDLADKTRKNGTIDFGAYEANYIGGTRYFVKPRVEVTDGVGIGSYSETEFPEAPDDLYDAEDPDVIEYKETLHTITTDNEALARLAIDWEHATADLQAVINIANEGDIIFVAAGTYKPLRPAEDWNWSTNALNDVNLNIDAGVLVDTEEYQYGLPNAFILKSGVTILGGFAGNEPETTIFEHLDERDFTDNATILTGDFNDNDQFDAEYEGDDDIFESLFDDNAYHVLIAADIEDGKYAYLDGFTITGGHSSGGIDDVNGIPSLAEGGAGILNANFALTLNNFIISGNTNGESQGGGLYNGGEDYSGEDLHSSIALTNTIIRGNYGSEAGGGVYNRKGSYVTLTNVVFSGNAVAGIGGGLANDGVATLINATVAGNYASDKAGGIANGEGSESGATMDIINSIIWGNRNYITIYDGDLQENEEPGYENVMDEESGITYRYSWVQGLDLTDTGTGNLNDIDSTLVPGFVGFIDFIPHGEPGDLDEFWKVIPGGDYRLRPLSSAINQGDNTANNTLKDIAGNPRINGIIDLGAYELPRSKGYFVKPFVDGVAGINGGSGGSYTTSGSFAAVTKGNKVLAQLATLWETACADLQAVINIANEGDTIFVATGTYKPLRPVEGWNWRDNALNNINVNVANTSVDPESESEDIPDNLPNAFILKNGVTILGGFAGNELEATIFEHLDERDFSLNKTILTGDFNGNDVHGCTMSADDEEEGDDSEDELEASDDTFLDNAPHVLIAADIEGGKYAYLDGFTITGGHSDGGIQDVNGLLGLDSGGAGIYNANFALTLNNFIIEGNISESAQGGGLFNGGTDNTGTNLPSSTALTNAIIRGNYGKEAGGGVYNGDGSVVTLTNVVLSGNMAGFGGGLYNEGVATLINVTAAGNYATSGGGIYCASGESTAMNMTNSIVWGNADDMKNEDTDGEFRNIKDEDSRIIYSYSWVQGSLLVGTGNLDDQDSTLIPEFVNYVPFVIYDEEAEHFCQVILGGDYRLRPLSSAINQGDNTANNTLKDVAGNPRINGIIDLGAYELLAIPIRAEWTGAAEDHNWNNPANWKSYDADLQPIIASPIAITDVWIPGGVPNYPVLSAALILPPATDDSDSGSGIGLMEDNACNNIYFMQGGQLGRQDLLTYNRAHVQFNLGLGGSEQDDESVTDLDQIAPDGTPGDDGFTATHLKYSAAKSGATPLARDRWYMLSPALQDVVSGDFTFGEYPKVFMRKFNNFSPAPDETQIGRWTKSFATQNIMLNSMEGFAVWVNHSGDEYGFKEFGTITSKSGHPYGLKQQNGILELPFYQDSLMSEARRVHEWDGLNTSKFYYILKSKDTIDITTRGNGAPDIYERGVNNKPYRFIGETYNTDHWEYPATPLSYDVTTASTVADTAILIGNPFMGSINFVKFLADNEDVIQPHFKVWTGTQFETLTVNLLEENTTSIGSVDRYIAPMQSFFVMVKHDRSGTHANELWFDISKIQSLPAYTASLRSSKSATAIEQNILRIRATNAAYSAETLIGRRPDASNGYVPNEDVYKLFSQNLSVPEVFTVADRYKLVMNFIAGDAEQIIPIGFKSDLQGATTLTLTGMQHYAADKIELIDTLTNQPIDITNEERFDYPFTHAVKGLEEGRFYLRIQPAQDALTGITEQETTGLQVYETVGGINVLSSTNNPIKQIELYSTGGQRLYFHPSVNAWRYTIADHWPKERIVVARIVTEQGVKNVKVVKNEK